LSKLARIVETVARQPQLQERITSTVADTLVNKLEPLGVAVIVEAEHMCMTMRGVKKPGASTITTCVRGVYQDDPVARAEVFSLMRG
jgi:GTP cyclohydrolase I